SCPHKKFPAADRMTRFGAPSGIPCANTILPIIARIHEPCGLAAKIEIAAHFKCLHGFPFDFAGGRTYHRAPMPPTLPDNLDPWRMVQGRRVFAGTLAVAQFSRLVGLLASTDGEVAYKVEFDRDAFDIGFVDIQID